MLISLLPPVAIMLPWAMEKIDRERQQKERLMDYIRSQDIDLDNLLVSDG